MPKDMAAEIKALHKMTTGELAEQYEELHGQPVRTRHRAYLIRKIAWRIQARMAQPLIGTTFALPDRTDLTPRLIGGAALFGTGWGIAGLCPGPGFAALVIEPAKAAVFVMAMLAGMLIFRLMEPQS